MFKGFVGRWDRIFKKNVIEINNNNYNSINNDYSNIIRRVLVMVISLMKIV